ncbi:FeoA family protein [Paremcibacter congregatus]|uniref:FeoA family protein n=1 Tax=Paremcibacter congregatus TaxID=2043170 RepID=UPI003A932EC1
MTAQYLSDLRKNDLATVVGFSAGRCKDVEFARDLEDRLLEVGFEEGLDIKVLHEGPVSRDPMAVRIGRTTIALRRMEADAVIISR